MHTAHAQLGRFQSEKYLFENLQMLDKSWTLKWHSAICELRKHKKLANSSLSVELVCQYRFIYTKLFNIVAKDQFK